MHLCHEEAMMTAGDRILRDSFRRAARRRRRRRMAFRFLTTTGQIVLGLLVAAATAGAIMYLWGS